MKKSKATVIYKTALHLLKVVTSSKEMDGNTFNKLILIIALLYKDTEHSHIKKELYALIQNYMLAIHSGAEWYKYFESNSSGVCFMTEPIYWDRDGKKCLFDYIDYRFTQFVQLISAISSSNKEAPLLILYWLFTEEKYSYYPDYTPRGITYEQVVEINYLKERLESTHGFEEFKMAYQLILTITETKSKMENSFSFKYIKLGVGLVLLLISSVIPGIGQYIFLGLGGIALITAFASIGNYAYRGVQSKLLYRIVRYVLVALLLITGGIQIDYAINLPEFVHYSVYATVVDCSLIAYLVFYKPSNTSTGKKIWKGIGYALVLIGVNALQNTKEFVMHLTYSSEEVNWGMFGLICGTLIAGTVCIRIGSKTTERDATDDICMVESTTQPYTSSKGLMKNKTENMVNVSDSKHKKYRSKQIILNIILSMALIIYMCSSLSFMDEGDGLTACGVIFYIPSCFIITTYYLWLIWSKGKATGAKMLLLPLLQRVNLFRTYQDDLKGKIELAKTVLPFLLSVFICPMLTSILYYNVCYNKHSQQEWLMVILLLPPVILVISLAKSWVQSWVSQNDHSEVEE